MGSSGLFPYPGRTCIAGLGDESRVDVNDNLESNICATQTEHDSQYIALTPTQLDNRVSNG